MANLTHREYIKLHGDLTVERMEALIDLWELMATKGLRLAMLAPAFGRKVDDILNREFAE